MSNPRAALLAALLPMLLLLTCCVTSAQDKKALAEATAAPSGSPVFRIAFCADSKGTVAPCPT
jgi:hypothetical protein